jgi:hypothetical protein
VIIATANAINRTAVKRVEKIISVNFLSIVNELYCNQIFECAKVHIFVIFV